MRKRSEIKSTKKPSAEERTIPLPFDSGSIRCPACDEFVRRENFSQRDDGLHECPECGAAITLPKKKKSEPESEEKTTSVKNPHLKYCGQCGSEWPILNDRFVINCGHMTAERIEDPEKAKKYGPPAGLQTRATKSKPKEREIPETPEKPMSKAVSPTVTVGGGKVSVAWAESMFRVADHSYFRVGSFILTAECSENDDHIEVGKKLIVEGEKLADFAFERQKAWYLKKLGLL